MNYDKIGKFIYELRKEKQITQKELADMLSVTTQAVSKWERGLGCPDISLLRPLADYFHISISELLNGEKINQKEMLEKVDDILMRNLETMQEKRKKDRILLISIFIGILLLFIVFNSNLILPNKVILLILITSMICYLPMIVEKKFKVRYLSILLLLLIGMFGIDICCILGTHKAPFFYFHKWQEQSGEVRYDSILYSIYTCNNYDNLISFKKEKADQYCRYYYSPNRSKQASIETEDGIIYLTMSYSDNPNYKGKNTYTINGFNLDTLYEQEMIKKRQNIDYSAIIKNEERTNQEIDDFMNSVHPFLEVGSYVPEIDNDLTNIYHYLSDKQFKQKITLADLKDLSLEKMNKETIVTLFNQMIDSTKDQFGYTIHKKENSDYEVIYVYEDTELAYVRIHIKNQNLSLDSATVKGIENTIVGIQSFDVTKKLTLGKEYQELTTFLKSMNQQ